MGSKPRPHELSGLALLNDKKALAELMPPENLPRRHLVAEEQAVRHTLSALDVPVVIKAADSPGSSGGAGLMVARRRRHLHRAETRLGK